MSDQVITAPDGSKWVRWEGSAVEIVFTHPETGEEIGPIVVPFDPDNQPPEEELERQAWDLYTRAERTRESITTGGIETLAEDLRTGEYSKWFARELRAAVRSTTASAQAGDSATPEEIAEAEETAAAMNAILRDKGDVIVDAILEEMSFWREVAHDILTHAVAWALDDLLTEQPDALELPDSKFHPALMARYREGGYLYGAILNLTPQWTEWLTRKIADSFTATDGTLGPLAKILEEKARKQVHKRRGARPNLASPQLPFDGAGRGYLPANGIYRGLSQALGRFPEWRHKSGDSPEYQLPGKYGVSGHLSIAGGNALRIWEGIKAKAKQAKQYGDILPDVYIVIAATIHEHRSRLDLFGNGHPYIAIDSLMHDLGVKKINRQYHPEDVEKVTHAIAAIGDIRIRGMRTAYIDGRKPVDVPFEGPIWHVMETIPKASSQRALDAFFSGERGEFTDETGTIPPQSIAGWTLAMSAGLLAEEDESPQEARIMRALMDYPPVHGRFKRRLGFSLACEFRLRYHQQNWEQPYTVRDVLEDAALAVDDKNPKRTYKLFHEALEQLHKDGIIGNVRYVRPPRGRRPFDPGYDTGKKGWIDGWLRAQIAILPPPDVEAHYREKLEERQSRRRGRKALKATG